MDLERIKKLRHNVNIDSVYFSIGEFLEKYVRGEIELKPNFQREYRWDKQKKSNLIESIALGIPLPSIFVFEDSNLKWQIIDGAQRLSTIFEFYRKFSPSIEATIPRNKRLSSGLSSTELLQEELKGKIITDFDRSLVPSFIKYKIHVFIVKEEYSTPEIKYQLFRRLNTGGEKLNPQEIRNAYLIEKGEDLFKLLETCSGNQDFKDLVKLTNKKIQESKDKQMILRILTILEYGSLTTIKGIDLLIETKLTDLMDSYSTESVRLDFQKRFIKVLSKIKSIFGVSAFFGIKKLSFSEPIYDTLLVGAIKNYDTFILKTDIEIRNEFKILKESKSYQDDIGLGPSSGSKISSAYTYGLNLFR